VGCYFQSDNEQKLSLEEMVKIVSELLNRNVPNDFILETFGVPVETKLLRNSEPERASFFSNAKRKKHVFEYS
jgi:hypothetical protein